MAFYLPPESRAFIEAYLAWRLAFHRRATARLVT
jgi:hypothetical protein